MLQGHKGAVTSRAAVQALGPTQQPQGPHQQHIRLPSASHLRRGRPWPQGASRRLQHHVHGRSCHTCWIQLCLRRESASWGQGRSLSGNARPLFQSGQMLHSKRSCR